MHTYRGSRYVRAYEHTNLQDIRQPKWPHLPIYLHMENPGTPIIQSCCMEYLPYVRPEPYTHTPLSLLPTPWPLQALLLRHKKFYQRITPPSQTPSLLSPFWNWSSILIIFDSPLMIRFDSPVPIKIYSYVPIRLD